MDEYKIILSLGASFFNMKKYLNSASTTYPGPTSYSKTILVLSFALYSFTASFGQVGSNEFTENSKGKIFFYWGWNRATYTHSDLHFRGANYNFDLKNVVAKDRPSPLSLRYLNPTKITIPQYNYRIGYFISPKYSISFGFDHMKYVMQQNQTVQIDGHITGSGTEYDREYNGDLIELTDDFLKFEHTNGLNYLNIELRRSDNLFNQKSLGIKNIEVSLLEGVGAGIMYPKTDVTLLNFERNDQWHLAGYGVNVLLGANITFFKHFFIQGELKGGYINMPNVLTTNFKNDHAAHHFYFLQRNVNFGCMFRI